jgi:hypothetical protein
VRSTRAVPFGLVLALRQAPNATCAIATTPLQVHPFRHAYLMQHIELFHSYNMYSNLFLRMVAASPSSSDTPAYSPPLKPSLAFLFSRINTHLRIAARTPTNSMNPAHIVIPFTYHGPSSSGNILVPTRGPHCPITFMMAIPVPFLLSVS